MSATDPILLRFWGKTPRNGAPAERFHPAIFHMIDVACAAEVLLRDGPPRLRTVLRHAWQDCDQTALLAWLPFLIATHDLGKISAPFQGQAKDAAAQAQRDRLVAEGVQFGGGRASDLYHSEISALWLHEHLIRREPGTPERLVWVLRDAMGGHHGRFCQESFVRMPSRLRASEQPEPRWVAWREETYTILRTLLAPPGALTDVGTPRSLRAATAALTGLIVWCDWIGSNEHDFPATPDSTPEDYLKLSRQRAQHALAQYHLRARPAALTYHGFRSLFPKEPRPLHELIDALPDNALLGPLLAVIEAPTGEGKTEAALALARRIAALSDDDEIFFALPTMATSNQMFTRLEPFYRARHGEDGAVRLVHGQALVMEEALRRRIGLAGDRDAADPNGASGDAALQWFVGPKKAMLAPFGVGTVDQVELAGLDVRHYPLRLFGLASKVVVLDEVHAYDAYMSSILSHTLTWLAALGSSVIMLSATLPAARHQQLAQAFLDGLPDAPAVQLPAQRDYPALAIYRAAEPLCQPFTAFRAEQTFTMRLVQQRGPDDEAGALLELVREGGAVARICNRVDDAQAIFRALRALRPPGDQVLLHARFPLHRRQERERRIGELVGEQTTRRPDQAVIIVGTQVLEQSLDYDVDVMVSDFAPIDLLLQRAGRLHRHARLDAEGHSLRLPRHAQPVLEIALPTDADGLPDWRRWRAIYEPYILWRTWEVLHESIQEGQRQIMLPRDYRPLIEAVYAEQPPAASNSSYAEQIVRAWTAYQRSRQDEINQARRPLTPDVRKADALVEGASRSFAGEEDSPEANAQLAKTRLGDRITLVPVYHVDGALALDPGGTWKLSKDALPTPDQQRDVLAAAVPVSDRRLIAAYRDERRPPELRWPWPERGLPALLRGLHPLPLDQTHTARVGGRILRLDPDLGLLIDQEEL